MLADSWNTILVVFLLITAIAAAVVAVSTWAVIRLQRQDAMDAAIAFEQYKLDTRKEIDEARAIAAKANERAEELKAANLALEAIIAPRSLSAEQQKSLSDTLKPFAGMTVAIASSPMDQQRQRSGSIDDVSRRGFPQCEIRSRCDLRRDEARPHNEKIK